jgi:cell fate regulator YaaT (PSP1 superfamily)
MGCSSCSVDSKGVPRGCGDKGSCSSGSCNKHNTYDWIASTEMVDPSAYNIVEVSFKKGSHKDFFINDPSNRALTGDMIVVETTSGYDIGRISLSGDLVRLQMKKKYTHEDRIVHKVLRKANERDLEKLDEARLLEKSTLVKSRVISRTLGLDMKVGDIEYQGDKKKATFYYTAEGRVDFRELVKEYAREFKVKIEMRQIGARQESARIGGIGSCGRELCCSTWLSDFKSVNTSAARYQNIAINQSKLSGQCGRLKCCLNYELDTYMDALEDFPDNVDTLNTAQGRATLVKTDIFKGLLYYIVDNDKMRGLFIAVGKDRVKEIKAMNQKGQSPSELLIERAPVKIDRDSENIEHEYEDVTGLIELRNDPKRNKNKNKNKNKQNQQRSSSPDRPQAQQGGERRDKRDSQTQPKTEGNNQNNQPREPRGQQGPPKEHSRPVPDAANSQSGEGNAQPRSNNNNKRKFFKKKGGGNGPKPAQ